MTRFAEFDKDGDGKLKLEEFYALLTTGDQAKGDASIRKKVTLDRFWPLFNSYDLDQDGFLGLHDFWRWSLGNAVQKYGVDRLLATIRQYDQDKTRLDARKFERWCDDQGFGACARELFQDLNGDGSGTVDCAKLIQTLSESKISDELLGPMHAALVKAYDSHARASLHVGLLLFELVAHGTSHHRQHVTGDLGEGRCRARRVQNPRLHRRRRCRRRSWWYVVARASKVERRGDLKFTRGEWAGAGARLDQRAAAVGS